MFRKDWDARNLKILLPGAVVGVFGAGLFAAYLSDAVVKLTVGVIALAFLLNAWLDREPDRGQ